MKSLFLLILLSGCALSSSPAERLRTAQEIAAAAALTQETRQAGPFALTSFARVTQAGGPANLYIEGDGLAWLDKHTVSPNPTPPDPVGLRLAAADGAPNVIYLARPCQYTGRADGQRCDEKYWTQAQSAADVIAAYEAALDALKAEKGLSGFHLIGYSGGAGIAALVAAGRTDVLSLRTVAGNTDHAAFTALHKVSAIADSVDPVTAAPRLARLPQRHFVGEKDKTVPVEVFEGWRAASGASRCVQLTVVPGNTHSKGWAEAWSALLTKTPSCD